MKFNFNIQEQKTLTKNFVIISTAIIVYGFMAICGLDHLVNFLPSSSWINLSIALSLILAAGFSSILLRSAAVKASSRKTRSGIGILLITFFAFYETFIYGLGPAITKFSSSVTEKDIAGTKVFHFHGKGPNDYFINTEDLPVGNFYKFYITKDEYNSISENVRVHVTLKQSFFGMTIESYSFN